MIFLFIAQMLTLTRAEPKRYPHEGRANELGTLSYTNLFQSHFFVKCQKSSCQKSSVKEQVSKEQVCQKKVKNQKSHKTNMMIS